MEENYIQLGKNNILRFNIKDSTGEETGNYLEFDLEDIELPLRLNQCEVEHKKNLSYIRNQVTIIDKKEDVKGKYALSRNDKAKYEALKEFYKREISALDLFLGEGGTQKLLNGRNPYYEMFDDISDLLEKYVLPKLDISINNINEKIKNKYSTEKEENTLE